MTSASQSLNICSASKYYSPVFNSYHRYLVLYGGRSSAKTHTVAQKLIKNCIEESYFKCVLIRNVYNTIKDSSFSKLVSIIYSLELEEEFHITKSPLEITHIPTGNKFIARGLDDPNKLKSLDDPNVMWLEEGIEVSNEESFVKIDTSIRSSKADAMKQMIITFNPEDEDHWINSRFLPHKSQYEKADGSHTYITSNEPNTLLLHTTHEHNDYCQEEDTKTITNLIRQYGNDSNYVKVYVHGLWGNALQGLVFENVNYVKAMPSKQDCKIHGYGIDFGFTNDPTAIVSCALSQGELWFELLTYETGLVNTGKNSIEEQLNKHEVGKRSTIISESAEPKSIEELRRAGFSIKGVKKGRDSIEASLSQMKAYKINIVQNHNFSHIEKEFKSYKYVEDKNGKLTNKPIDAWNHSIDALRYWFMMNVMKDKRSKSKGW